jgi:hypothetical protein
MGWRCCDCEGCLGDSLFSTGGRKKLFFEPCRWRGGVGSQSADCEAVGSMSVSEPSLPGDS